MSERVDTARELDYLQRAILSLLITQGPLRAGQCMVKFDSANRPTRHTIAAKCRHLRTLGLVSFEDSQRWSSGGKWSITDEGRAVINA